jgi:hypothetical protein
MTPCFQKNGFEHFGRASQLEIFNCRLTVESQTNVFDLDSSLQTLYQGGFYYLYSFLLQNLSKT